MRPVTTVLLIATMLAEPAAVQMPSASGVRNAVRQATLAVEGDSVARVRARWVRAEGTTAAGQIAALGLATLDRLTYAYPASDARYIALERTAAGQRNNPIVHYAQLGRASSYATRYQTDSATTVANRALRSAVALRDSVAEAQALLALGRVQIRSVGTDSALRMLSRAEAITPRSESALLADIRCSQGRVIGVSNAARGDTISGAALRLAQSSGERRSIGRCWAQRAGVLEIAGLPSRAVEAALKSREILQQARDLDGLAATLQMLAYLNVTYAADFAAARKFADSAVVVGQRSGNPIPIPWAQLNLAQVALRFGDFRSTSHYTEAASRQFERLDDRPGIGSAFFLRGDAAYLSGRLEDARSAYQAADTLMRRTGWTGARVPALMRGAGASRELGRLDEAERAVDEAVRISVASGFVGISQTDQHYERGLIAMARGNYGAAIRSMEEFLRNLGADGAEHIEYDARARIAEALAGQGRLDAADSLLREVERTAEGLRRDLADRAARIVLLDGRRFDYDTDLGFATIVSRFAAGGRTATAFRIAEARRARNLWTTMLRRNALREVSTTGPELRAARLLPDEVQAARLAANLPDSTALLEYVTGRGGEPTTLFVVTRQGIAAHKLPTADSLLAPIASFVSALESGSAARGLARRLGVTLLGSAMPALSGVKRLVIIPDGPLYRLPFDALEIEEGRPALTRFAISVAPSARIPVAAWAAPTYSRGTRVLAFGNPAFGPNSRLPRLPASAREVRAVLSGVANSRALLGERATEAALKQSDLRDVRVLHFATHAEVEDFGLLRSALSLAPGGGEDGRVGVEDIAALDLDADLVVLSGCRTAGGVVVTGEGIQGLVGPFLEAGARAVVATQWPVGDRSIVPLMTRFYRELRLGRSAGDALQAAKLASRAAGEPASVWASAVIAGDARVRPFARRVASAQ